MQCPWCAEPVRLRGCVEDPERVHVFHELPRQRGADIVAGHWVVGRRPPAAQIESCLRELHEADPTTLPYNP